MRLFLVSRSRQFDAQRHPLLRHRSHCVMLLSASVMTSCCVIIQCVTPMVRHWIYYVITATPVSSFYGHHILTSRPVVLSFMDTTEQGLYRSLILRTLHITGPVLFPRFTDNIHWPCVPSFYGHYTHMVLRCSLVLQTLNKLTCDVPSFYGHHNCNCCSLVLRTLHRTTCTVHSFYGHYT